MMKKATVGVMLTVTEGREVSRRVATGAGDSSVNKVLPTQAGGPEFNSQAHIKCWVCWQTPVIQG